MNAFHLGKPLLAMAMIAVAAGLIVLFRPAPARTQLELWTFAQPHADSYERLRRSTSSRPAEADSRVLSQTTFRVIPNNALNVRLVSLFMADRRGTDVPDIVEIRQDALGRYLGPPADQIGFLPLNALLNEIDPTTGKPRIDRFVAKRFAPYTKSGQIFGLPHDVHPVTLTYRADLFAEAGVDLESPTLSKTYVTWADFQQRCLTFQSYWRSRGVADRWAMDLLSANAEALSALLLQRGINLVDADGGSRLTDPFVVDTLLFYAGLVAGPGRISTDAVAGGVGGWRKDLESGNVCALLTPDWRIPDLREAAPSLVGKLRMVRLPKFEGADSPTSSWGGTMIAIPRNANDPKESWRLIESLYLSPAAVDAQLTDLGILPAVADAWSRPAARQPDPLFVGGQHVGELYAQLAPMIPTQHLSADTAYAGSALGYVLTQTVGALRSGADVATLRPKVIEWLQSREKDVKRQLEHGKLAVTQ